MLTPRSGSGVRDAQGDLPSGHDASAELPQAAAHPARPPHRAWARLGWSLSCCPSPDLHTLGFTHRPQQENEAAICTAITADLGRPSFETITGELNPTKGEVQEAISHLDSWTKPVKVKTSFVWALAKATIYPVPKGPSSSSSARRRRGRAELALAGVALIIGTWNCAFLFSSGRGT